MPYNKKKCELMFKHGCGFAECGKHCEKEPISSEQKAGSFTIAGIVNSAFSCEIFLKTLLIISGSTTPPHGHKLLDLWNKLEKQDSSLSDNIRLHIQNLFISENSNLIENLLDVDTISDAFHHWRYIYEDDKITKLKMNRNFIRIFRDILQEICCEKLFGCSWSKYVTK
ncbi:MAG: hypothetical protein IJW06_03305 [Clostridia bacterium]|nr:hypothetical protein [Clostridia bacterium]